MARHHLPVFQLPPGHEPGVVVPSGPNDDGKSGARCSTCKFYHPGGSPYGTCGSPDYFAFYGTNWIPVPPHRWCTDWWDAAEQQPPVSAFALIPIG